MRPLAGSGDATAVRPLPQDHRFTDPAWEQWPHWMLQQAFLLGQQWWHRATTGVEGVSRHHEDVVAFCARQALDLLSPTNSLLTNPEVLNRTIREGGARWPMWTPCGPAGRSPVS